MKVQVIADALDSNILNRYLPSAIDMVESHSHSLVCIGHRGLDESGAKLDYAR